jgi:hypothetical protein
VAGIVNPRRGVSRGPLRLRRRSWSAILAAAALGVAGSAEARQSAELSVTVTVVRSCTVTDGSPACGATAAADRQAGTSLVQPAPRTTTTVTAPASTPPAAESGTPAPSGPAIVTIHF